MAPLQPATNDNLASGINAVDLEYRLGDIEPMVVTVCMLGSSE